MKLPANAKRLHVDKLHPADVFYYPEFASNPPKFFKMLEHGIGYETRFGSIVLYGPRVSPQERYSPPLNKIIQLPPLAGACCIYRSNGKLTRHHLTPKQVFNAKRLVGNVGVVKICSPCHVKVHQLFTNAALAETHWPDVVEAVQKQMQK